MKLQKDITFHSSLTHAYEINIFRKCCLFFCIEFLTLYADVIHSTTTHGLSHIRTFHVK